MSARSLEPMRMPFQVGMVCGDCQRGCAATACPVHRPAQGTNTSLGARHPKMSTMPFPFVEQQPRGALPLSGQNWLDADPPLLGWAQCTDPLRLGASVVMVVKEDVLLWIANQVHWPAPSEHAPSTSVSSQGAQLL